MQGPLQVSGQYAGSPTVPHASVVGSRMFRVPCSRVSLNPGDLQAKRSLMAESQGSGGARMENGLAEISGSEILTGKKTFRVCSKNKSRGAEPGATAGQVLMSVRALQPLGSGSKA